MRGAPPIQMEFPFPPISVAGCTAPQRRPGHDKPNARFTHSLLFVCYSVEDTKRGYFIIRTKIAIVAKLLKLFVAGEIFFHG